MPIAILSQNQEVTLCQMDGHMTREEVAEALELAKKGCETIHQMQRDVLTEKYKMIAEQIDINDDDSDDSLENEPEDTEEDPTEEYEEDDSDGIRSIRQSNLTKWCLRSAT